LSVLLVAMRWQADPVTQEEWFGRGIRSDFPMTTPITISALLKTAAAMGEAFRDQRQTGGRPALFG